MVPGAPNLQKSHSRTHQGAAEDALEAPWARPKAKKRSTGMAPTSSSHPNNMRVG